MNVSQTVANQLHQVQSQVVSASLTGGLTELVIGVILLIVAYIAYKKIKGLIGTIILIIGIIVLALGMLNTVSTLLAGTITHAIASS